jgi:anti-anti-sigma factor
MTRGGRPHHAHLPGYALANEPLDPDGVVVVASGELDVGAADDLREHLRAALDAGATRVVIDLSAVSFIDSLSLAAIVGARRRLAPGGRLAVVATHHYVRLILDAAGVASIVDVYATRDEAQARVAPAR